MIVKIKEGILGDSPSKVLFDEAAMLRKQSIATPKFKIAILSQAFKA